MPGVRAKIIVGIALLAVICAVALWWALPRIVAALPGRVRQYVPESVAELVTTPLPTALPAPSGSPPAVLDRALGRAMTMPGATRQSAPLATAGATEVAAIISVPAAPETVAATRVPEPARPELPPYNRIDGVPIIPQKFNNCGPTNLTIVLNYYGETVDQFDVAGAIRPNYEDRNVSPHELVRFVLESTGLSASVYAGGDVEVLRRLVAAGVPVIVEKGLEPDETTGWMGHYLTIYGYDDITGHFYARDTFLGPWRGDGLASYGETERYWEQFNRMFVVIFPPERAVEIAELLGPTMVDPVMMWQAAVDEARSSLALDPDNAFAWFNLGSSLVELAKATGDVAFYEGATAAYDQARHVGLPPRMLWYQFGPYEAYLAANRPADVLALAEATLASQGGRNVEETYYYLGLALSLLGDEAGSRAALARAIDLNPGSPLAESARLALDGD